MHIHNRTQEVQNTMEEVIFDRLHETAYRGTMLGKVSTFLLSILLVPSLDAT